MKFRTTALFAALLAAAAPAWAQTASIKGTVLDPDGKRIATAAVLVQSAAGVTTTAVTGAEGTFAVGNLVPGLFDVEVTAPGFALGRKEAVRVTAAKPVELTFTLSVAPFTEEVS